MKNLHPKSRLLQEGERLIYSTGYHWWFDIMAWMNAILLSWLLGYGFFLCLHKFIIRCTTEINITNRRVIYRRGWLNLQIDQVNIDRVEGSIVQQTLLGRLFDFGTVIVRGTGVGEIDLPRMIARPNEFRRALDEARDVQVLKTSSLISTD